MKKNLQNNIWKYTLLLIVNKRIFVAVLGAYYLTIPDVTPKIIGTILLAGSLSGFIFEIPSGYMSDKIGHKLTLVVSRILMLMSTIFFLVANNIILLILGAIFLSASAAFQSGTGSAFMHETLQGLKREHDYTKVMGKISSIGFAVPIIFMVLIPFLISISYKTPFLIAIIFDVIGLLIAISLVVPPVLQEHIEEIGTTNFKQILQEGYRLNFFSIALFSGIISGTLFSINGFRSPYQAFLEIPIIWYGVFFGIGRIFASLMLAYGGKIKKYITLPSFYRFQLIIYTLLILVLGTISNWWVVVIVFITINAFQWGLSKVDEGYQLDIIKSSKFKATLLSTGPQISQIVSAISSFSIGFMIERISYQYGFLYSGIIFIAILFPLYLYIVRKYKSGIYKNTEVVSC
ncbi:MAG: MFS transporter [Patescibacteria group bacterium]|nr:MFS transporter [Patescibacteria group bacterium]MDD4304043.1 MFS transporter [Patescibacteria group bacterium]MDD4694920.1 MFS transporter [Patescibacteria group bacterium]